MHKTERRYTDYKFEGIIPYDNALAKALQWLYDESEFKDDKSAMYYMNTRLPLYDFMTLVVLFIGSAYEEYGVTKLHQIIQLLEEGKNPFDWQEKNPTYKYENNDLLVNKMETCTTEVILWAAYIYCLFRSEELHDDLNAKCHRAKDVLYDLFKKKSCLNDKAFQKHFLMQHRDATMRLLISNWLSERERNEQRKGPADRKPADREPLTTQQQALFVQALAEFCEKSEECKFNKKQRTGLATITSKLFGCGEKSAYNQMGSHTREDKEAVAVIFDEAWPKFAEFIRNSLGKEMEKGATPCT